MAASEPSGKGTHFLVMAASLVVVIAGLKASASFVVPFLIAIFIAMISLPLLNGLQKRNVPTWLAALLTIVADLIAVVAVGAMIGGSVADFTAQVPKYKARLTQMTVDFLVWLQGQGLEISQQRVMEMLDPGRVLGLVTGTLTGVAGVLQNVMLVVLAIVFILFEAAGFPTKLDAAFGDREASRRFDKIRSDVQHYLAIKTLVSLATGAIVAAAMAIIGVDFPLLWGLLAFLLNYIPALGSIIAAVPPLLVAMVQPEIGLGGVIAVAATFLAVNVTLGNFIEPYLMGQGLGLSTLVVFISLVFWGWIWGPVGMLVSVPLTMIIKIMLENSEDLRWVAVLLDQTPRPAKAAAKTTDENRLPRHDGAATRSPRLP